MRMFVGLMLFAVLARARCVEVASERIAVRDLLEAAPALAGLDPETVVGFAPLPGTQRILAGQELSRIARQHGVAITDIPDVCIERAAKIISPDEMRTALVAALGIPEAELEILEYSNQPLPPGTLEFQRPALSQPPRSAPESPVIWRGRLIYDGRHSAAVWAKVRILVDRAVFVAAEEIAAGSVIQERQVKPLRVREFPYSGPSLSSLGEIAGKVARRSIPAGQRLTAGALEEAKAVAKGDVVQVRVIDGLATLSLEGIAQSAGNRGDTILVHNSASGRNFRAVVEEKGKAVVRPSSGNSVSSGDSQ